jgi:hypothetical protein
MKKKNDDVMVQHFACFLHQMEVALVVVWRKQGEPLLLCSVLCMRTNVPTRNTSCVNLLRGTEASDNHHHDTAQKS